MSIKALWIYAVTVSILLIVSVIAGAVFATRLYDQRYEISRLHSLDSVVEDFRGQRKALLRVLEEQCPQAILTQTVL